MSKFQAINSSGELDYPKVLPTLDLNFSQERALDPRVVFARSSGGTYVDQDGFIKIAGVNQPRFTHNPFTGECLGLLVEESRSNSIRDSSNYNFTNWHYAYCQLTTNATTAPDGTNTAGLVRQTNGTSTRQFMCTSYSIPSTGSSWTASVYVKRYNYDHVIFTAGDEDSGSRGDRFGYLQGQLGFNFATKQIIMNPSINWGGNITGFGYEELPDGWYRVWFSKASFPRANYWGISVQQPTVNGNTGINGDLPSVVGDGISGVYVWGFQWESGPFYTSHIPTGASALTRSADIVSLPSSQFFNSNRGSINLEFNIPSYVDTNNDRINYLPLLSLDDNTASNSLELGVEGANPSVVRYASGLMRDAIIPKQNLIGTSKSVTSFTSTGGYVAQASLPSPNGDNDGFLFIDNATDASYHHIGTGISSPGFTNNFVHVVSVYAKRYNSDFVFLQATDSGNRSANAVFSFANPGAATQTVPGVFGTIYSTGMIDCGDGWYRLYIVFNISSTAPVYTVRFGPAPAATGNTIWGPGLTYTSSGLGVYFANPQIERACIIGKYISTTSGSVTNTDYYNSITKNKIWKMVYNYNNLTNEASVILDGKPFSLSRQTSSMPYNTLRIGSNSANTRSNAIVRRLSYYPNTISNSNSISLIT